jgi:hypothetical protein
MFPLGGTGTVVEVVLFCIIKVLLMLYVVQDLEHGMWFELKTKFQFILININYRSVRQAPAYYWQYFDFMLKRALDENCNNICLGDLNINFMANVPTNIRDIIVINGFVNNINKPTHFDNRTGNYSLLDPILITDKYY